jgi:hypothetical protein
MEIIVGSIQLASERRVCGSESFVTFGRLHLACSLEAA